MTDTSNMIHTYSGLINLKKMKYGLAVSLLDFEELKRDWRRRLLQDKYLSPWQFKVAIALLQLAGEEYFATDGELSPIGPIKHPVKIFACSEKFIKQTNAELITKGILTDATSAGIYTVVFENKYLKDRDWQLSEKKKKEKEKKEEEAPRKSQRVRMREDDEGELVG